MKTKKNIILSFFIFALFLILFSDVIHAAKDEYYGTITITKRVNQKTGKGKCTKRTVGTESVTYSGTFDRMAPQENSARGLPPMKIYGASIGIGTWKYNEDTYKEGDCDGCTGLVRQEWGSGLLPDVYPVKSVLIQTYVFPTEIKKVKDQLARFGLVNWYQIMTPSETVQTQSRSMKKKNGTCQWSEVSASKATIPSASVYYKMDNWKCLEGSKKWSSSKNKKMIGISTLTDSVIDEKPYNPEQDGSTDVTYTIAWSLGECKTKPALKLKEVHFNYDGNKESRVQMIRHQDEQEIKAPEWTAYGERKTAAFIRKEPFKVKVIFGVEGNDIQKAEIWAEEKPVEGSGKKGFDGIEKKTVTFSAGEREKKVEFSVKTPQSVVSVNNVQWYWKAKVWYKGSNEFEEVEIKNSEPDGQNFTEHTIYTVYQKPSASVKKKYEFVVKKGCQWAEGDDNETKTFDDIWKNFEKIPCPDAGTCSDNPMPGIMAYDHSIQQFELSGFLKQGKGTCRAWQEFFYAVMGSQGINVNKCYICPKPDMQFYSMVAVPGEAQGNPSPWRIFKNHAIIEYGSRLYDPSYKQTGATLPDYENKAFSSYCGEGDGLFQTLCMPLQYTDPQQLQKCLEIISGACSPNNPSVVEVTNEPGECPKKSK